MRKATQKEIDDFVSYRANHIALVQKLGKLVFGEDFSDHDSDKCEAVGDDLELYALRNAMLNGDYRPVGKDKREIDALPGKHVKTQKHHPEFWDTEITDDNWDDANPPRVNAHHMPPRWIKEMISDWTAVALKKNSPIFKWYNMTCCGDNPRFDFTDKQKELITDSLELMQKAVEKNHITFPGVEYNAKQVEPLRESGSPDISVRLDEADRSRFINANPNLTSEQKAELVDLFRKFTTIGNDIKWGSNEVNNWTYEKFLPYIKASKQSKSQFTQNGMDGLEEGSDYEVIGRYPDGSTAYAIHSYKASVVIASNSVAPEIRTPLPTWAMNSEVWNLNVFPFGKPYDPKTDNDGRKYADEETLFPGAKWCTAMQTSSTHFDEYLSRGVRLAYVCRPNQEKPEWGKVAFVKYGKTKLPGPTEEIYDASDNHYFLNDIPAEADAGNESQPLAGILDDVSQWMNSRNEPKRDLVKCNVLKRNEETGRYDSVSYFYSGDDYWDDLYDTDENGNLTPRYELGTWQGDWNCAQPTLIGAPRAVEGNLKARGLKSLEGCPSVVRGDFDISHSDIESLEHGPVVVGGDYNASHCHLKSLNGAPYSMDSAFIISGNDIESLEGCPRSVGSLDASRNPKLRSLAGAPETIWGNASFDRCVNLESLDGMPHRVHGTVSLLKCDNLADASLPEGSRAGSVKWPENRMEESGSSPLNEGHEHKIDYSMNGLPDPSPEELQEIGKDYNSFWKFITENRDAYLDYFSRTGEQAVHDYISYICDHKDENWTLSEVGASYYMDRNQMIDEWGFARKRLTARSLSSREKDVVTIYRSVMLNPGETLDTDNLGECWSLDDWQSLHVTDGIYGKYGKPGAREVLVTARTKADNFNSIVNFFLDTIYGEAEMRLKDPKDIEILSVEDEETEALNESTEDNFRKWFGNSKVVDENGKPLVVYHGTSDKGFNEFSLDHFGMGSGSKRLGVGFYFTNREKEAGSYGRPGAFYLKAERILEYQDSIDEDKVFELYMGGDNEWFFSSWLPKSLKTDNHNRALSVKNGLAPADARIYADDEIDGFSKEQLCREHAAHEAKNNAGWVLQEVCKAYRDKELLARNEQRILGIDCVHEKLFSGTEQWCVLFPNQIKSVDNNGDFNPSSNNIYESRECRLEEDIEIRDGAGDPDQILTFGDRVKDWRFSLYGGNDPSNLSESIGAGPVDAVAYHGSEHGYDGSSIGKKGVFLTDDPEVAAMFGNVIEKFRVHMDRPLEVDMKGAEWPNLVGYLPKELEYYYDLADDDDFDTEMLAYLVMMEGKYDGIILRNIKEGPEPSHRRMATDYVVFSPSSLDPIDRMDESTDADEGCMAPNGRKSNLTPEQWAMARTPEFIEWFGDWMNDPANASKVVDENGEPMVVYHGSDACFEKFVSDASGKYDCGYMGRGFYFTTSRETAGNYIEWKSHRNFNRQDDGKIYEVFLNLRNPVVTDDEVSGAVRKMQTALGMDVQDDAFSLDKDTSDKITARAMELGHDGAFVNLRASIGPDGEKMGDDETTYVVYSSNQIKSATDNNGEFSMKSDNIYENVIRKGIRGMETLKYGVLNETKDHLINRLTALSNEENIRCGNLNEKILKKGNKWQVTDHTGKKNLGTYDTKADAEKRLKQVEYFKHLNEDGEGGAPAGDGGATSANFSSEFSQMAPENMRKMISIGNKYGLPVPDKKLMEFKEEAGKLLSESVIDIPRKEYCKEVLDGDRMNRDLRIQILKTIKEWKDGTDIDFNVTKVIAKGSLLTRRYNDTTDLDVTIHTDMTKEQLDEIFDTIPRDKVIEGTNHPIDFYVLTKGEETPEKNLDDIYDVAHDKWLKRSEEYDNPIPMDYVVQVGNFLVNGAVIALTNYENDRILYQYYKDSDPMKQEITDEERKKALEDKKKDLKCDLDGMRLALHMISSFRGEAYADEPNPFRMSLEVDGQDNPHLSLNEMLVKVLEKFGIRDRLRKAVEECDGLLGTDGELKESLEGKTAAFCFGRFNPTTQGHLLLFTVLSKVTADAHLIYTSHSQDKKKNPLDYETKSALIKAVLKENEVDAEFVDSDARTIIEVAVDLYNKGYKNIIFVGGADRVEDVTNLLRKYNDVPDKQGRSYHFDYIGGMCAGERDPDSDDIAGVSGTKVRQFCIDGDFESFCKYTPLKDKFILKEVYDQIRSVMAGGTGTN